MFDGILQPTHLIIVLIIALVVLGPKRLPDAGRAIGQALREFKNSVTVTPHDNPQIAPPAAATDEHGPRRHDRVSADPSDAST